MKKSTFESNYNLYSKCFDSLEIFIYLTPHLKFLLYDLTNWKNLAMFSLGPFTLIFSPAKEFKVSKFSSQHRFPSSRNATNVLEKRNTKRQFATQNSHKICMVHNMCMLFHQEEGENLYRKNKEANNVWSLKINFMIMSHVSWFLRSNATSNQYTLIINGKPTTVYCLIDDPNSCGGGGWTTVMKIIGATVQ